MRDYVREMMDAWTQEGEQAAYDLGVRLLRDIKDDWEHLRRQESAINSLGSVLEEHADVDAGPVPVEPETGLEPIETSQRPRFITEAAIEVWQAQQGEWTGSEANLVKSQGVLDLLKFKGLDLGVQQPLAVVGTVLASADGFTKVARNTFEYNPRGMDLPIKVFDDAGTPIEAW